MMWWYSQDMKPPPYRHNIGNPTYASTQGLFPAYRNTPHYQKPSHYRTSPSRRLSPGLVAALVVFAILLASGVIIAIVFATAGKASKSPPVEMKGSVEFNWPWNEAYNDPTSTLFQNTAKHVQQQLRASLASTPGVANIEVTSFRQGSVVANYVVQTSSEETRAEAAASIGKAIQDGQIFSNDPVLNHRFESADLCSSRTPACAFTCQEENYVAQCQCPPGRVLSSDQFSCQAKTSSENTTAAATVTKESVTTTTTTTTTTRTPSTGVPPTTTGKFDQQMTSASGQTTLSDKSATPTTVLETTHVPTTAEKGEMTTTLLTTASTPSATTEKNDQGLPTLEETFPPTTVSQNTDTSSSTPIKTESTPTPVAAESTLLSRTEPSTRPGGSPKPQTSTVKSTTQVSSTQNYTTTSYNRTATTNSTFPTTSTEPVTPSFPTKYPSVNSTSQTPITLTATTNTKNPWRTTPTPPFMPTGGNYTRLPPTRTTNIPHAVPKCAFQCENMTCLDREDRCDNVSHCISGEDEVGCTRSKSGDDPCKECTYGCTLANNTLHCICPDGYILNPDERSCSEFDNLCAFQCKTSSQCLPYEHMVCDHINDCLDKSDEQNCEYTSPPPNCAYRCANGQCLSSRPDIDDCSRPAQCEDGSDRWMCPVVQPTTTVVQPTTSLVTDNFFLATDSGRPALVQIDTATGNFHQIAVTGAIVLNPIALDYDPVDKFVYWSDVLSKKINRCLLDGSNAQSIRNLHSASVVDGLVLDKLNRKVYYTDTGDDTINRMNLDGSSHQVLVALRDSSRTSVEPRAIVLDVPNNYMYFTDWGNPAAIERARLDGSNRQKIVTTGLVWPNGLALSGSTLCWCDASLHTVECSNTDGFNRRVILDSTSDHFYSILMDSRYIFATSWNRPRMLRIDRTTGTYADVYQSGFQRANDMIYYSSAPGATIPVPSTDPGTTPTPMPTICPSFRCSDGRCIPNSYVCDGDRDCLDGSDERNCTCEGGFVCDDGRCLRYNSSRCDGYRECKDGSDERNCTCDGGFVCDDGICIPYNSSRCDGYSQCPDGSDERDCPCDGFKCDDGRCLRHASWQCDGYPHCYDASDELNCPCDGFRCNNYTCIALKEICNGIADCSAGVDEQNCTCDDGFLCDDTNCLNNSKRCDGKFNCADRSDERACDCEDGFVCDNNLCLPNHLRCDGFKQCKDGTDEIRCTVGSSLAPPTTECEGFVCDDGCIPYDWQCDLITDCLDGSDEVDCGDEDTTTRSYTGTGPITEPITTSPLTPPRYTFPPWIVTTPRGLFPYYCTNESFVCRYDYACIPLYLVCDGYKHCRNGEDEVGCGTRQPTTLSLPFTTKTTRLSSTTTSPYFGNITSLFPTTKAIPFHTTKAVTSSYDCTATTFRCWRIDDRYCVPMSKRCDYVNDCPYGEDEDGCPTRDTTSRSYTTSKYPTSPYTPWLNTSNKPYPTGQYPTTGYPFTTQVYRCSQSEEFPCSLPSSGTTIECIPLSKFCDGEVDCQSGDDEIYCPPCEDGVSCTTRDFGIACIENERICDGTADCLDLRDEKSPLCELSTCAYSCDNGTSCYNVNASNIHCNSIPHCLDRTDEEENCTCIEGQFACIVSVLNEMTCLPTSFICDGFQQCIDGSDEMGCPCNGHECDDGRCIPSRWICDGYSQCLDRSDEQDCPCDGFKCDDGLCLPFASWKCDGDRDCPDGSDERDCPCDGHKCGDGRCIPSWWICDGDRDCSDGSDEIGESQCDNGQCLRNSSMVCNGYFDCSDLSDERNCTCEGGFVCDDGICLPYNSSRCNGYSQCPDGSDERDCPCDGFTCDDGECLRYASWQCDGYADCSDGSDERDCPCNGFECNDGECISSWRRCDSSHVPHCDDASDEINCTCDGGFICLNGQCVNINERCDGTKDCKDGSDEIACPCDGFKCDNKECLPLHHECDGHAQCSDASDEINCPCVGGFICDNKQCLRNVSFICNGEHECLDESDEIDCSCDGGFLCDSTNCLYTNQTCDNIVHCRDQSDEMNCTCEGRFSCDKTRCIDASRRCDGIRDCIDGADEYKCQTCSGFRCASTGYCLPAYVKCSGSLECPDASDEMNCTCDGGFVCDNGQCLTHASLECDEKMDCLDQSDERDCPCDGFKCTSGLKCIPPDWQCDYQPDCPDASDEINCTCSGGFECDNGQCLPFSNAFCNGVVECYDESDEAPCPCDGFKCNNYKCISSYQRCNYVDDCGDASDEIDCPCNGFRCDNGQCLPFTYYECDGRTQCSDGSDELYCKCLFGPETFDRQWYCDGQVDCYDGWDESNCTDRTPCMAGELLCPEGDCIPLSAKCNGIPDCLHGQDEQNCDYTCGSPKVGIDVSQYIVGGSDAYPGAWPWQIALFLNGRFQCGGTIIGTHWVITAAHCIDYYSDPADYKILVGTNIIDETEHLLEIDRVLIHESYDSYTSLNDIALLWLKTPIEFSDEKRPVCLANDKHNDAWQYRNCFATGWGDIESGDGIYHPSKLQQAPVKVHTNERCLHEFTEAFGQAPRFKQNNNTICMGDVYGKVGGCQGDSGGPIVCQDKSGIWRQVGISSWGSAHCNTIGVFTKVSAFIQWLEDTMKDLVDAL